MIYRLARQRGLQDADAHGLTQQVLMSVSKAISSWEYRDEETRFRHWLRRVARNAIVNALTRTPPDVATGGTSIQQRLVEFEDSDNELQRRFDQEYRRELYLRAAADIRRDVLPKTWPAFQLSVIDGLSIEATAREIGESPGTVYAARSRIMRRLQDAVCRAEQE